MFILSIRFAGTIVGIEDVDSIRWPDSEWRRFKVKIISCNQILLLSLSLVYHLHLYFRCNGTQHLTQLHDLKGWLHGTLNQ